MSWITVVWPMIGGACLTLAAMHLLVWLKDRRAGASFAFAGLAACVACITAFELVMMRVQTPEQFAALRSWMLVPVFVGFVCILAFVRLHFQAGRLWLAHATWIVRLAGLVFNSVSPPHLFYREINGLRQVEFFGATITVADGVPSPWLWLNQLSVLLLVTFVADAAFKLWRGGSTLERRRAAVVGGSLMFFLLVAGILMALVSWQVIAVPYFVSPIFMVMVAAMGFELSRDVLRAAQLARDLRESEQRMELAAGAARLGLWTWDVVCDEVWITDEGRALFGWAKSEPVNFEGFMAKLHPEDREVTRQAVQRSLSQPGVYDAEYRVQLAHDTTRWIAARGQVEFDAEGQPVRMRGVSIDITERKQAEAERGKTEQEIQRHRQELAHISRVSIMGELSASMAHELNQPLAAILTNAQAGQRFLAASEPDLEEFREILKDIAHDTTRARDVIRHLRALVKKSEPVFTEVDLGDAIREVVGFLHGDIVARNVCVVFELSPQLPAIHGDRIQLQQVMINLLLNAFDAMNGDPAPERLATVATDVESHQFVRVTVRDRGTGIPADKLKKIFEPFYSTKREGMGMGLSVTRSIVESHGGHIWAENDAKRGAMLHFTLRVAEKT